VREVDEKIAEVRLKKESAIDGQDFELAARLRDEERQLQEERSRREQTWKAGEMDLLSEIDEEEIAEVLSVWTGIPVFKLTEEETDKLLRMEDELHKRIISQQEAISAVSRAMRRTRSGLKDPRRPSGSFIFLGPSGVGKTELSKALAEFLFGDEDALIQLDMSEFHDQYTVSRLIGSPPGYVGYDEGGQLTEAVRRKPFSVVLFDEIEKAHPNVFDTLLQILEDGHLTDGQGRTVDFKNTIIIMTSNLGTRDIQKGMSIGFASNVDKRGGYERMKSKVEEELKRSFRPEFINRIDEVIVFHSLDTDDVKQIVDLLMRRVEEQLKAKDIDIDLTDAAKTLLAEQGWDQALGARPLRRTIQRLVEDPLSEKLLHKEYRAGESILVDAVDGEIVFNSTMGFLPPDVPPVELAGSPE
jgi:ATP-dependent Clp protease ATP-binding subunit ClpC